MPARRTDGHPRHANQRRDPAHASWHEPGRQDNHHGDARGRHRGECTACDPSARRPHRVRYPNRSESCGLISPGCATGEVFMASATAISEVAILDRVIRPERDDLSPEAARSLLRLEFDGRDGERMNELSAKASDETLTADEERELDCFVYAGHLLALLQSKARQSLKKDGAGS